jgi:hypothetical protein
MARATLHSNLSQVEDATGRVCSPEAKRLAAYIDALALDATLALPAHAGTNGNRGEPKQSTTI